MKKTLLFKNKTTWILSAALVTLCFNYGTSQTNLVLNGTCDDYIHTASENGNVKNVDDNADAWDMTPNSTVIDNSGTTISSPYRALWNNSTLEQYLEDTYVTADPEDDGVDEQPGSSSDGSYVNGSKTRGVKVYDDANGKPAVSASTRRLYQKVAVTPGTSYTFSIDSRSEASGIPSEVFMLNEEITTEAGLENGASDSRVDAYFEITNDHNSSKGSAENNTFTTNSFSFTASGSFVVIYVRALLSISKSVEVFYDNISLIEDPLASTEDVFASNFSLFPNPANDVLNISSDNNIDSAEISDLTGKVVISASELTQNSIDISSLAKGVYILRLVSGDVSGTTKFIKK
ncbi:T9SS type A sorting domain-containing protein [Flavicella marina]|uniref:T9SS type A sorting domain-containing protein n=1 Tax=Flavicella marina TaxID=1475951 RepID=UPI0012652AF8|nr:T9SS type A sorting domain-containing protein [Flavicella marina]